MPYVAKPKPCYMDQFEFYKVIDGRKVYRGNGRLYSWDGLHGEIEVFNKQGWHLGALDAKTGELIKQARKDRRLRDILYCRRHSINYHDYINLYSGDKIAARSYNLEEVKKYKKDGE